MEGPTEEKKVVEPTKKFRFANQYVMLTYPKHLNKVQTKNWFAQEIGYKDCEIGHEIGETGYKHTHVVINFGKRFQSTNARVFDLIVDGEINHPNIQPFRNHEWIIKCNYISKQDPENAHLKKNNINLATKIWAAPTLTDALMMAQKPADVSGIKALYDNKPQEKPEIKEPIWRDWQAEILDYIEFEQDNRAIIWIRDRIGGAGKTEVARWAGITGLALVLKQFGGTRDSASIISEAVKQGWNQRAVICDLSRDFEDREIYAALESIKDGTVTTTKYTGGTVYFNRPTVVVFANYWPNVNKMSKDRWRLFDITKDGEAYNIKKASLADTFKEDPPECDTDGMTYYL